MLSFAHEKIHHHFYLAICYLVICMFFLCALDFENDIAEVPFVESKDACSIDSLDYDSDNIASNEDITIVFIKNANSRNSRSGKSVGSRKTVMTTTISLNWVSSNIFIILGIYLFKTLISSRHLIISYIHSQDGMKL